MSNCSQSLALGTSRKQYCRDEKLNYESKDIQRMLISDCHEFFLGLQRQTTAGQAAILHSYLGAKRDFRIQPAVGARAFGVIIWNPC